jgi:peroxiredoxin
MSMPLVSRRLFVTLLATFPVAALLIERCAGADEPELPPDRGLMQRVANFTLKDVTSDRTLTLYGYVGRKAIVLVFMGNDCPVGNLYAPRLVELNREYKSKGVVFLGINSNAHETAKEVARFVRENGIDFPVLKDLENKVADGALVERTCEVLLLDGAARVRYRGAIDDQYSQGKSKPAPAHTYLRDALDALLADKPIKVRASTVAGCLLDRVAPKVATNSTAARIRPPSPEVAKLYEAEDNDHPVEVGKVSYSGEVAAILQNKCQSCHRSGQVAPFSLLTYDDARKHSAMIQEVVEERRMPPWHADPRYGHFANDRSLSPKERATVLAWVAQGSPLGNAADVPPPRDFPQGWTIGKPDVVFEIPEPYYVPAQGVVAYVHFVVPTNFTEEKWIQAAEAVPGDRSAVHHIVVYLLDPTKTGERGRPRPIHFCGYAPGDLPTVLPPGTAKRIPVGVNLLFQIHYTPNGKVRKDRSRVGLIFAKTKPTREAFTIGVANTDFLLQPHKDNVAVASSFVVPTDVRLLSFLPHMHLRGKDFKYSITRPGESSQVVLSVPSYDFAWQTYYVLSEPISLPKGSRIDCQAHFDNSEKNPYNPDPSQLVRWGEQTFEEMMIGYMDLDVPVGTPTFQAPELVPARERLTMQTIQTLRRFVGGNKPGAAPGKRESR